MDRFNYIIPGIYDGVDDPHAWDYQAQLWLYKNGLGLSAGFNYFADIIGGVFSRQNMAAMVASDLRAARRAGCSQIVLICHSNGCHIAADALRDFSGTFVSELHLIAAAMPQDCDDNGLNLAAQRAQVGQVVGYVSDADEVLGLGPAISYGEFGKKGPENMSPVLRGGGGSCYRQVNRQCRHGDWVGKDFLSTMDLIAPHGGTQ